MKIERLQASQNIAAELNDTQLTEIGQKCLNDYLRDKQSRRQWEIRMADAMKIAIQLSEKKNTPWSNASNVKFPLLSIACVQFSSRVFPQLFATPRPVKMRVIGDDPLSIKHDRAKRIAEHMSFQVLEEDETWIDEHDKLMMTLPIMGSGFIKTYYDGITKSTHVHANDLVADYYTKSLDTCQCYTHEIPKYRNEIIEKQRARLYLDQEIRQSERPDNEFDKLSDDYHGQEKPPADEDTPIRLHEQYCWIDLDEDGYKEPYTVIFDDYGQVFRIINRFAKVETDGKQILKITPKSYFTKYTFMPSPDGSFYDMGFGNLLTPINESVNTLINQLIDAGTLSNRQGGFLGRGARLKSGALKFRMGEWQRIDSTGDDIRKNLIMLPFKEPSHTLFTLLTYLVEYGERLSSVSDMMVGKTPGQNTPATTAMAALEEGMKVITAIYQRIYRGLKREFQKRYLLNQEYLDPQEYYMIEDNQKAIFQQDYLGDPTDVRPAADPNMSSDVQRLTRLEAISQRAQMVPGYNIPALEKRYLEQLNVEGIGEIYPTDNKGRPVIQPPPDPRTEIEATKFQAEQMYKAQELQIKASLADSQISVQETQALLNLAKAESMDNQDEISKYQLLLDNLRHQRELVNDGFERFSAMENRSGNENGNEVPESSQGGNQTQT